MTHELSEIMTVTEDNDEVFHVLSFTGSDDSDFGSDVSSDSEHICHDIVIVIDIQTLNITLMLNYTGLNIPKFAWLKDWYNLDRVNDENIGNGEFKFKKLSLGGRVTRTSM